MVLRDAAGRKRLGVAAGRQLVAALEAAGYEVEPEFEGPPRFESEHVVIRRAGGGALAKTIEALLPHIRVLDAQIPQDLPWRDGLIAEHALRGWKSRPA